MNRINYIQDCVRNNKPVVFCKFGDGEYYCMIKYTGNGPLSQNCDNDTFTQNLSDSLVSSFKLILPPLLIQEGNHFLLP